MKSGITFGKCKACGSILRDRSCSLTAAADLMQLLSDSKIEKEHGRDELLAALRWVADMLSPREPQKEST